MSDTDVYRRTLQGAREDHGDDSMLPVHLKDRKGGDPAEWPEDIRVRQFPEGR